MKNISTPIAEEESTRYTITEADDSLPGTPPSSLWSFIDAKTDIKGVVLTDYDTEYNNKYYHSIYDTDEHIDTTQICFVGKLLAQTIYALLYDVTDWTELNRKVTVDEEDNCKLAE
eukprot:UN28646